MENPQFTAVEEYKEPVNYIGAIIGALLGGALVVAIWAGAVFYINWIEYRLLALSGALVGFGAIVGARRNNLGIGLIALLIAAVAMLAGDYLQMMYVVGRNKLDIDDYIRYSQEMFDENLMQYVMYLISIGIAFFLGVFGNRSGAQVASGQ